MISIRSLTLVLFSFLICVDASFAKKAVNKIQKWKLQIRKNPDKPINYFNLAVAYHKKKKFRSAIINYRKAIELKSRLAPVGRYYLALAYQELGKIEDALDSLQEIDLDLSPPTLKKRTLALLEQLLPKDDFKDVSIQRAEKRLDLFWNISVGSNNNPEFAETTSGADFQYSGELYVGYQLAADKRYEVKSDYTFSSTSYLEKHSSNTTYHGLTLPLSYYLDKTRIRLTPEYSFDTYDGDDFSRTSGATVDFTHKLSSWYLGASYRYLNMNVVDTDNAFLSGYAHVLKVHQAYQGSSSRFLTSLSYSDYRYADTDDVISTYTGPALAASYTFYVNHWDIALSGYFEKRSYKPEATLLRRDERNQVNLSTGYSFRRWMRLYASATYGKNQSNDDENDYEQVIFLVGTSGSY